MYGFYTDCNQWQYPNMNPDGFAWIFLRDPNTFDFESPH